MKKVIIIISSIISFLLVGMLLFILLPAPVDPVAYSPPQKPELTGVLALNTLLTQAERIADGLIQGPETIAVDNAGNIYGGTQDGKILRIKADGSVEQFSQTGGRPLGLMFDQQGNLIVCDAYKGLLLIDAKANVTVLTAEAEGLAFKFTDDLDIASDGKIYFSDASFKFDQANYLYDLLEARPHGRLLVYDPDTKQTTVLLHDLYFANGIALSHDEDFVLVNETYRYRTLRYWLKGEKAGTSEVFIDNLPGFPDGLSYNDNGIFWMAMFTIRNDIMDSLHPNPFLKSLLSKLPRFLWPKSYPYGLVLAINEQGKIIKSLHDPEAETIYEITAVCEQNGYLYMGFLHRNYCARYKLSNVMK
jgi:sugar lactone lactonase YvrE